MINWSLVERLRCRGFTCGCDMQTFLVLRELTKDADSGEIYDLFHCLCGTGGKGATPSPPSSALDPIWQALKSMCAYTPQMQAGAAMLNAWVNAPIVNVAVPPTVKAAAVALQQAVVAVTALCAAYANQPAQQQPGQGMPGTNPVQVPVPSIPGLPGVPMPTLPGTPGIPSIPGMPNIPGLPVPVPGSPPVTVPQLPGVGGAGGFSYPIQVQAPGTVDKIEIPQWAYNVSTLAGWYRAIQQMLATTPEVIAQPLVNAINAAIPAQVAAILRSL